MFYGFIEYTIHHFDLRRFEVLRSDVDSRLCVRRTRIAHSLSFHMCVIMLEFRVDRIHNG